jgi:AraC-like DNA-binding protein
MEKDFLSRLTEIIQENISDEMFGVSELAAEIGMSRSNLLRKIKKLSNVSASQFIRQVRLQKAMEMLRQTTLAVSEISYKVGFSSTSYFIKCFRDEYGYPPGEAGRRSENKIQISGNAETDLRKLRRESGSERKKSELPGCCFRLLSCCWVLSCFGLTFSERILTNSRPGRLKMSGNPSPFCHSSTTATILPMCISSME